MSMFDLTGKVAVITGGTRGIGLATAEAMAAAGAKVVVSSRKADACDAVASAIKSAGGEATGIACNVSRIDELEALIAGAEDAYGQIDILVCNAAVNPYMGPLLDIDDEAYDKILTANVKNVLRLCGLVIPGMAARKDGAVVIVSSIAATKGSATLGAYAISKAADVQLARNLALEWGRDNVRINCVLPGLVKTDMARALWENPERHERALAGYPMARLGEPEDLAGAILFLASPAATWITGQALPVDGGATIAGGGYS
jgi:NAD(P)-dependent dehydrogenase (short-subunit alcohol dehydrogenase family)